MADKTINLEVVTPERIVFQGEVDFISAPGTEGRLGILPEHAPLMTGLKVGQINIKQGKTEIKMAVSGGFLETKDSKIVILADSAETAEQIDIARAKAAKDRAEKRLSSANQEIDITRAELALNKSLNRLKVRGEVH
jgi:F-type H+-transporting ATPase subunit epsilon